ncbi:MAG: fused MFS/spermidine synthase [Acidobacteriota bacterium]|nr:fused MFS/spermidine synthase [Acidobacteriota bacterium]
MQPDSNPRAEQPPVAVWGILVLVGFTAVIGQIVLMRELILLFNGNELSMGLMLATWLLWTAAGSSLTGLIVRENTSVRIPIALAECLCGLSLPLTVWALRSARALFQTVPGEVLGPAPVLLISLVCLSVFCLLSGCLFVLAVRSYQQQRAVTGRIATSYAYLLETAGSGFGGIFTSLLLLRAFGSFQLSMIVALLNLGVAASLIFKTSRRQALAIALAGMVLAVPLLLVCAPRLEESAQEHLWKGFQVLGSQDSIYGKLTVVDAGGMHSIYDNGSLIANVPDESAAEESVHYALLEHPAPGRILLIGGGINGSIVEALKHPTLQRIDYVELDPSLISVFRRFFPAAATRAFADPRIHVHYIDGRLFLKQSSGKFDAILLNLPDPQTAQLNRFYTVEFFRSARDHLAPGGLLALQLGASEDYISPALADFLRCIRRTLREVFPYVTVIPGGTIHFFSAVQPGILTDDPQVLVRRLQDRNLQTLYVREYFIPFRMMPDRMTQIHDVLQPLPATAVNRDFHPAAYYFDTVLWSAQFKSGYSQLLRRASHIPFASLLASVAALSSLFFLALALLPTNRSRTRAAGLWSVFASGYTLMTLQILVLLAFQSVYGYVYGELAMLIGMFMAGIASGTWFSSAHRRTEETASLLRRAAFNQAVLAIAAPLLLLLVSLLARNAGAWIAQVVFPALALLCAIPGGYQFPIATEIYLGGNRAKTGAGTLYALDLLGGCAGALLLAGFSIPLFGFWNTAWLATAVSLAPALLMARASMDARATGK